MEKVFEEKFVETFICKRAQGRILSGLSNAENRKNIRSGLSKLMDYINSGVVYLRDDLTGAAEIESEIKKLAVNVRLCYVIAGQYDGVVMPFKEALNECFNDNLASIIIVNDNLAFIKTEVRNNRSMKYILYKKPN